MTNRTTPVGTVDEELVERVAKALFGVAREPEHDETWENVGHGWQENFREHARAAIEASGLEQLHNRVERLESKGHLCPNCGAFTSAALTGEHNG